MKKEQIINIVLIVILSLVFLQTCGTKTRLSKLEKQNIQQSEIIDSLFTKVEKLPTSTDLRVEGLKNEKRMIQSTDRKMLDIQRQTQIEKEIEELTKRN